jgi:hypothetical protein
MYSMRNLRVLLKKLSIILQSDHLSKINNGMLNKVIIKNRTGINLI